MIADEYKQLLKETMSARKEMLTLLRFVMKKEHGILLRHNQSMEMLKKRSQILYQQTTKQANKCLQEFDVTTETLKIRRGHQQRPAVDSLKSITVDMCQVEELLPEIIEVEKDTAVRLKELATLK